MKKLILVLFAIATFSLGINAQDLSFQSFNKTLKPKGELVVVVENEADKSSDHFYQEWGKYGLTQWQFRYGNDKQMVRNVSEDKAFYDELEISRAEISRDGGSYNVWIPTKNGKNTVFQGRYIEGQYSHSASDNLYLTVKTKQEADDLLSKLKDKAFDMSLDLDVDVERVSLNENIVFNQKFPNGINENEFAKMRISESEVTQTENNAANSEDKSVNFVRVTLKHTGGERYYLSIIGDESADCTNQVFSFTHSKYGEETRTYTFCEGQKLIDKNTGRVIFTATKPMDGTTYKIN